MLTVDTVLIYLKCDYELCTLCIMKYWGGGKTSELRLVLN